VRLRCGPGRAGGVAVPANWCQRVRHFRPVLSPHAHHAGAGPLRVGSSSLSWRSVSPIGALHRSKRVMPLPIATAQLFALYMRSTVSAYPKDMG
jgi:hypothetical protein